VLWELRALLLPWSRGEGEGRRAGAAHLGAGSLCQQKSSVLGFLFHHFLFFLVIYIETSGKDYWQRGVHLLISLIAYVYSTSTF